MRATSSVGAPSMNVRDPAVAPTTPPDMGASTKLPRPLGRAEATTRATEREEEGSIVEQSMKRRGWGRGGRGPLSWRREWYADLTCCGSGRQVMTVSYAGVRTCVVFGIAPQVKGSWMGLRTASFAASAALLATSAVAPLVCCAFISCERRSAAAVLMSNSLSLSLGDSLAWRFFAIWYP